ncbi:MAG: SDR family NAD(P)-dependent oxidoreductase [Candidatus Cloacimonetes bacterium]|nr:SDR family NAD(P)-dependent oxidoreductase [Candidatus Cloacimonadota bacterium]
MKLILISGANGQVGSYLANAYRAEGYKLALLYHNRFERLKQFESDQNCFLQAVDLSDFASTQKAIENVTEFFKQTADALIHCAALRSYDAKALAYTNPQTFTEVISTNILGAYHIVRALLPQMLEKRYGRIVLFGSDVSRKGLKQGSAYAAAKAAIVSLAQSVALETIGTNVLINAISPAPVETNLEEDFQGEYLEFRRNYFANFLNSNPGLKLISKAEIKIVVDLLINPEIQTISGQELFMTGGLN